MAQGRHQMNGSRHNSGFSFIELMVVIAVIAAMAAIIVPRFGGFTIDQQRTAFLEQLNALTVLGWQQALVTGKLHRILFDFKQSTIRLESEIQGKATPATVPGATTVMPFPHTFVLTALSIEGDNVLRAGKRATAWYYLVPQGLAQAVEMRMRDEQGEWRASLNPFTAQFSLH